jgi:hypothetical protein
MALTEEMKAKVDYLPIVSESFKLMLLMMNVESATHPIRQVYTKPCTAQRYNTCE